MLFLHPVNIDTPMRKSQLQKYGKGKRERQVGAAPIEFKALRPARKEGRGAEKS
jgi:hypothetical protein